MSDFPPPPPNFTPPPGYVAYGGPGAVSAYQRISGLTKWLVGLLVVGIVLQLASLFTQLQLRSSANDFLNGALTEQQFKDKLSAYGGLALLSAPVTIGGLVVLCIWTFRMAKNLQVLGRTPQTFSTPGATVAINILGQCLLGILNALMWIEIWRGSDPSTPAGSSNWKKTPYSPIILVHLGLFAVGFVLGILSGVSTGLTSVKGTSTTDLATNLHDKTGLIVGAGAFQVAAAIVFVVLARQLAARHMQATHTS